MFMYYHTTVPIKGKQVKDHDIKCYKGDTTKKYPAVFYYIVKANTHRKQILQQHIQRSLGNFYNG